MVADRRGLITFLLLGALAATACASAPHAATPNAVQAPVQQSAPARDTHEGLNATLWMQTAVEYRMATEIVYRTALPAIQRAIQDPTWTAAIEQTAGYESLPPAVVADVDETLLDNSHFQAQLTLNRRAFERDLWNAWVLRAEAVPIPGALEFATALSRLSPPVKLIYITNRGAQHESATIANLVKVGFPADAESVLCASEHPTWTTDKGTRRGVVAERYRIVALMGDDLGDFVSQARSGLENRIRLAKQREAWWGERWFVLPNPTYGSWESALYDYDSKLSDAETLARKWPHLTGFQTR